MIRLDLYLSETQKDFLKNLSDMDGRSIAGHVRLAIDDYIKKVRYEYSDKRIMGQTSTTGQKER